MYSLRSELGSGAKGWRAVIGPWASQDTLATSRGHCAVTHASWLRDKSRVPSECPWSPSARTRVT